MSKYGAKTTVCNHGHKHASKREAKRCGELHLLERGGQIIGLKVEPTFQFWIDGKPIKMNNGHVAQYRPDFTYIEGNRQIAEDVKGMVVRDFPLRAALFRALYPDIELRVTK